MSLAAGLLLIQINSAADELYKYHDANGNLVYTDRKPTSPAATIEPLSVGLESKAPRIEIQAVSDDTKWRLVATNECLCVVEFGGEITEAHNLNLADGVTFHQILAPRSQQALLEVAHSPRSGTPMARVAWKGILGAPGAEHSPPMPYRAPFALGASYKVTQAYPVRLTHASAADQYAVDFALPDGTPVNAAREGTVINVKHDKYMGAATPLMMDQANMVEILHDDGTIAIYAHLHWDSVRVQPGQHVRRGEYIADSGSTGFSTGAHLHFAVVRNTGMSTESVPVQFAGPGGTAITAQTDALLTAY
ncbi:MAG TPA: peptidoglycan DD-metalloendopeptidase family protein [Steroidobacteraceae bacterium]|nr:peptidoglycan DD-metalloendopeptidase family protein [Steroidobacteraceae bacterium]